MRRILLSMTTFLNLRWRYTLAAAALAAVLVAGAIQARQQTPGASAFASQIAALSEPGGYFDTDNLISNEQSYLHVVPALRQLEAGGVYIGVGPDQNFSYIAHVRPRAAFIIDIRRDNLLLHLLFKGIFDLSPTRIEYLAQLCGRPVPEHPETWREAAIDRLVSYIDESAGKAPAIDALRTGVDAAVKRSGVPLSAQDFQTIDRFHRRFIAEGLGLRFHTTGRMPQTYYPTFRDLLFGVDRQGHHWNYLASEADFQFVRSLEVRDLIVPVVGDLAGPSALAAIGRVMKERGDRLSAFYASNVEYYLFGDGRFTHFVENIAKLPHTNTSVVIRSVFGGYARAGGSGSEQLLQPIDELIAGVAAGRFQRYRDLIQAR